MLRLQLLLFAVLLTWQSAHGQEIILQENFGSVAFDGNPSDYPDYTSDAQFSGDDSHVFVVANSSGYAGASGGAAVRMGSWNGIENTVFVLQANTTGFISIRLSFGITHNSDGWGPCTLTNNFTGIEYSTDSAAWVEIDKAALEGESSWPCADENTWSFVRLSQVLPSSSTLYIRFTHTQPDIHPYALDDITLTAYPVDETPPTAPANLFSEQVGFSSFTLSWNASEDDNGIQYYEVLKNGNTLMFSRDTITEVRYQEPGGLASYSVIAHDVAENISGSSASIQVQLEQMPADYRYSWEREQARILPSGDMEWKPEPFVYKEGASVRYIDYENGDDASDGMSRSTPWKHHPWDDNATGLAAQEKGIHTYVFKRGVIYRGQLSAEDSGSPLDPVRITSDPSWGLGEACFFGSERISGTWKRASTIEAPGIPEPEKVWYIDIALPETKMVCEVDGDRFRQLHVARSPNYRFTEDDPLRTWYKMTGKQVLSGDLWLTDNKNLVQDDPAYYRGATIFSQEDAIVMCTVWKQDVLEWDPDHNRIRVDDANFGGVGSHYFIENTPFLLDTVNEFYYDKSARRLFVRLQGERDPNTTVIEAANRTQLIRIDNRHNIGISGITFGITTEHSVRYSNTDAKSVIRMSGICSNIRIQNNRFLYVNGGVSMNNTGSSAVNSQGITVSDNDFLETGDHAIIFAASGDAYMDDINILRNNIFKNGFRHQGRWYGSIPAIYGQMNYGEVAGNIVNYSFGNGIDMFWGKGSGSDAHVPFVRGFIHQNKAANTLIGTNDYGGIESWQGGPTFCYNNYSHNAMGYKHYLKQSIGYAYYFDGSFKHIVFNNIASGVAHNRNSASVMQVLGFYNMYVHNTGYNTKTFFNAWKGDLALNGHNVYLANVAEDIHTFFRHEIAPGYIPFDAYGHNFASGMDFNGSLENLGNQLDLEQFRTKLEGYNAELSSTGVNATQELVPNAGAFDFRLLPDGGAGEKGVKFFTAFPLSKVVGEWNFYLHPADPGLVRGDNFYMTEDFSDRITYKDIPKNHLAAVNVTAESYIMGDLEDWTHGALQFDGASVYCVLDQVASNSVKSNNVDMDLNSFIVETYVKTAEGHTNGALVTKYNGNAGYALAIDGSGKVVMTLYENGTPIIRQHSAVAVSDTAWHHILAEVDRNGGISIFIDGVKSPGEVSGTMPATDVSLANTADLLVGRTIQGAFFHGAIDFLRISRGALYEARTTADEIYKWQTSGPFLFDMRGNAPEGSRDAGALESITSCDLSVSVQQLDFDATASEQQLIVTAADGFFLRTLSGSFFSVEVHEDTLLVAVDENETLDTRNGSFEVAGCNTSIRVSIAQEAGPCVFMIGADTLRIGHHAQLLASVVSSNHTLEVAADVAFVTPWLSDGADTVYIDVAANVSVAPRTATVSVVHCDGTHQITVEQDGAPDHVVDFTAGGLEMYPNPVTDHHIYIRLPEERSRARYAITDLSGKVLQQGILYQQLEVLELLVDPGACLMRISIADRVFRGTLVVI
ncbi:MAG: BACON domain-containing carbohydrate-binding protein [Bacteroidales bacterium]|nr:BACON domain-containing carbohydrate-binding protein [Bacteroidales bacterium]MDT8430475.1 LamG-like jellyroll fold domain-containing protein [Bacteroidales bacterium]